MNVALGDGIPRAPSPQQIIDIRQETARHIEHVKTLESIQSKIAPAIDAKIEDALFTARATYRVYFCRTFRMNDLPNEIITNIFRYVIWSVPDVRAGVRWRLWLTWTCRRWRTIALEDSTLWNAVWFRDRPPFHRSFAWFERAGLTPLDIRISPDRNNQYTAADMKALLKRLFVKVSTIRILIFIVESWDAIFMVLDELRAAGLSGVPISMERIELHRTGTPYIQIGPGHELEHLHEPIPLFGGAPAPFLQRVSFNGVHINWNKTPFTNLTGLDIRRMPLELAPSIRRFREILSSSPALQKLCFDGAGPQLPPEDFRPQPPIPLEQLKILVVGDFSAHYAHYVLSQFTAPHLRDLTLINLGGEDYSPLFQLLTGRYPELKLMTFYSIELPQIMASVTAVIKWLETLPLLTYLRLSSVPKIFLGLFIYDPRTRQYWTPKQTLCPKLSIIEAQSSVLDQLLGWIPARAKLGAPVSKIYAVLESKPIGFEATDHTRLQERTFQDLCARLNQLAPVFLMPAGSQSAEEEVLRDTTIT
ncbi:hypothetical protein FPV67DRAFT_1404088 [Lyophyllum atratum]|nr:hypothetical protein FPV67DRAFT_1404088 [Lyophyllum atratum]